MRIGKQRQHGSVFMGMLVTVAVVAVMLMEVGTLWSSVLQRERELELLARGNEIRWGVVAGPGETIMGVFSQAKGTPFKHGNFSVNNQSFTGQGSYQGWVFLYGPGQSNPSTRVTPMGVQLTPTHLTH